MAASYKEVQKEGMTAAILNNKRILILKRINFPFISHPGAWYFVAGAKKANETPLENAYREIREETGLEMKSLTTLLQDAKIIIKDDRKSIKWSNSFFIFYSKSSTIRLNIEHTAYKWATLEEFVKSGALDFIQNSQHILKLIKANVGKSQHS